MDNSKLLNAISVLVTHIFKYRDIVGDFPSHGYLMTTFEIEYEFADHVLMVAKMISGVMA